METAMLLESRLYEEVERLRIEFPQTQDLYREVCILLFFRYGVTPTANKLYQLVRKGSMSAPAEALMRFWEDLREKSRIRIEHPDLPEELKQAAAELTAKLWNSAQQVAHASLAACEEKACAEVAQAQADLQAAQAERMQVQQVKEQLRTELGLARQQIQALEKQAAGEAATRAHLEEELQKALTAQSGLQQRLDDARREFAAELEKLRQLAQMSEERSRAAEARAMVEIDRERTRAARLQKELAQVRTAAESQTVRVRSEFAQIQDLLGEARQENGILEGRLQTVNADNDRMLKELNGLRAQATEQASQLAVALATCESWRARAEEAQNSLRELQQTLRRRPRRDATTG